uniref:Peptidase C1A papain C-terminal domain-containing protein n=1 Tax=Arundo donax TaxID=35708 RepID=A0A0A9BLL2_ARUDO
MALDSEYPEAYERWTLKKQVMDDGETKILSPMREQDERGCCYFALAATLEPNLKVQCKRAVELPIPHLRSLDVESRIRHSTVRGKVVRLALMIQDEGVFEKDQYEAIQNHTLAQMDARRYKITHFRAYHVDKPLDIRRALYKLRSGGPLLAVIRISDNYDECYESGMIYRFDPSRVVWRITNDVAETHAVAVVSFVVEAKVPCLECQDSHGKGFGRDGFLLVDITSVKELYSFRISLSG